MAKWALAAATALLAARWKNGPTAYSVVVDAGLICATSVVLYQIYSILEAWKDTLRKDLLDRAIADHRRPTLGCGVRRGAGPMAIVPPVTALIT